MIGVIKGTGAFIPRMSIDNECLSGFVETSDAWIRERTGIEKRHVVSSESNVSMAVEASRLALRNAGVRAEELEMILVSTISPDNILPSTACELQRELKAERAASFDINAACSGFLMAYNTANAFIQSGAAQKVLLVGSECLSNIINWKDRTSCILFGDGAGAAVITAKEGKPYLPVAYSDGKQGSALTLKSRHSHNPFQKKEIDYEAAEYFVQMNGQEVFKFAVRKVPQAIEEVLKKNGLKKEEIDLFVLHQANMRIVEAVAKRLGEDLSKFPTNLEQYGNTSSASIPILLYELQEQGILKSGQRIVLAGFGGGLTWGASIIDWL